jgi:hypothetical protein
LLILLLILFPALTPNFLFPARAELLAAIIDPRALRVERGLTKFFPAFIA